MMMLVMEYRCLMSDSLPLYYSSCVFVTLKWSDDNDDQINIFRE